MAKKSEEMIRSSAAEYLTYVAAAGEGDETMELRYQDENIWLTQKMMAELYGVSVSAVNQHLKKIFEDGELLEEAVIKKYLITASDGKQYNTKHYNLQAIIAVGGGNRQKLFDSSNGSPRKENTYAMCETRRGQGVRRCTVK